MAQSISEDEDEKQDSANSGNDVFEVFEGENELEQFKKTQSIDSGTKIKSGTQDAVPSNHRKSHQPLKDDTYKDDGFDMENIDLLD